MDGSLTCNVSKVKAFLSSNKKILKIPRLEQKNVSGSTMTIFSGTLIRLLGLLLLIIRDLKEAFLYYQLFHFKRQKGNAIESCITASHLLLHLALQPFSFLN